MWLRNRVINWTPVNLPPSLRTNILAKPLQPPGVPPYPAPTPLTRTIVLNFVLFFFSPDLLTEFYHMCVYHQNNKYFSLTIIRRVVLWFAVLTGHDLSKIHLCCCILCSTIIFHPPNGTAGWLRVRRTQEHRARQARPGPRLHVTLTPSLRKHDCVPGSA